MIYKFGSLFAGVGGICLGFKNATYGLHKYEPVWANEVDEYAAVTYKENFNHELIVGDIEKIVNPLREENPKLRMEYLLKQNQILNYEIDILTGGFPCQSFSITGSRKGFDDHRGNLFWSIIDLINLLSLRKSKPRIIFLENVKNLQNHDKGNTYKIIKDELVKLGYSVKEKVINTKDFSTLPQNRERIYIVGFLDEKVADNFKMFDELENFKVVKSDIKKRAFVEEIIDSNITFENNAKYYYTREKFPHYFLTEQEYLMQDAEKRKAVRINLDNDITEPYEFYQLRRGMYVRMNMNGVCPTLTANMGTGGHNVPLIKVNDGIRKLTPVETFKLQGFPIDNGYKLPSEYDGKAYSDSRLYKQAGNSVSVDIVELIAKEILNALDKANDNIEYVENEEGVVNL
jgi:DNA (cytosine-5)-methyltransferase 1